MKDGQWMRARRYIEEHQDFTVLARRLGVGPARASWFFGGSREQSPEIGGHLAGALRRRQLKMPTPKRFTKSHSNADDFRDECETNRAIVEAFRKQCDLECHADDQYAGF